MTTGTGEGLDRNRVVLEGRRTFRPGHGSSESEGVFRPFRVPSLMERIDTSVAAGFFEVVGGTERSQAATMVLDPGESTGGPKNRHPESDQWLYVADGRGTAVVEGESHPLSAGTLVLVEAGETHEIRNDGDVALETVSVYAPPEY